MTKEKTIKKHEEEYYHISKERVKYIFFTLILVLLCIGMYNVLISSWNFLGLKYLKQEIFHSYQLVIIPSIVLGYILISLTICSFVSIFKKLKSYKDDGLIYGLIWGLIWGLIGGLIIELILGLILELIWGLIYGGIYGLIMGLILGLIWEFGQRNLI